MSSSDLGEIGRFLAVGTLGWVTIGNVESTFKLIIAIATAVYMVGKSIQVWRSIIKNDEKTD